MITQDLQDKLSLLIMQKDMKLYDVELLKENETMILRISIFKPNGVTLDDCETISSLISPLLDVELTDLCSYNLEVSSPGIERTLKKPQHFLCSIGQMVAVTLPNKAILTGILESYNNQEITIKILNQESKTDNKSTAEKDTQLHKILLSECKKVKTIFDWNHYELQKQ